LGPSSSHVGTAKKPKPESSDNAVCIATKPSVQPSLSPDQIAAIQSRKLAYLGKSKGSPASHNGHPKPKIKTKDIYHKIHYCLTKDRGCICAWTEHPNKFGDQGFSGKAYAELQKEEHIRQDCHIDHIAKWRSEDSPLAFKPASQDSDFPYNIMIRCVADPSNCTPKNAQKWINKNLVPYFNRKGREYSNMKSFYQIGIDTTTNPPSPLSEIVARPDVFEVIERAYPNLALHELLNVPSALSLYFYDAEQGKFAISGKAPGEDASSGSEW
jgi:hypothetical protein